MKRIGQGELRLGDPMPFDIYDSDGQLLLRRGHRVQLQSSLDRLLREGIYRVAVAPQCQDVQQPKEKIPAFQSVLDTRLRLGRLFGRLLTEGRMTGFVETVRDLARMVREAVGDDREAALAGAYLDLYSSYYLQHHMQAAVLAEILGTVTGLAWEEREALICAALTHDLGLLGEQDQMEHALDLTEVQQKMVHQHPGAGAARCAECGVENSMWLEIIRNHHERLDGTGYPDKIGADRLSEPVQIMSVVDCYSAMIRNRPYRKAMCCKEALRELYLLQDKLSTRLTQLLIRELGVLPPGSLVQLKNGEIAVIVRHNSGSAQPEVCAFINQHGVPLLEPQRRDVSSAHLSIARLESVVKYRQHVQGLYHLWN